MWDVDTENLDMIALQILSENLGSLVLDIFFSAHSHKWWKSEVAEVAETAVGRFAWKTTFQQHSHRQTTSESPRGIGGKSASWLFLE